MAKGTNNGGAPQSADFTAVVPASTFLISLSPADDFDLLISATGKGKLLTLPDGSTRSLSPGLEVTLTNLENGNTVTLNATGTFRTTGDMVNGETIANGHNLVFDPIGGQGIFYTTGHFRYGFEDGALVPLSGKGQVVEVITEYLI